MAVFATLATVVSCSQLLGPTLGGWLTDQYSLALGLLHRTIFRSASLPSSCFPVSVTDPPVHQGRGKPGKHGCDRASVSLAFRFACLQIILDKGQVKIDWFGAIWIRCWTALIVIATVVGFLIRELKIKAPLVDLRVFRDRNFALGCLLIGLFGGVIYGVVTLLPLFYQTLLGYTAGAAGIAVSPRGIGAIMIMPVIGVLTGRLDITRWLIVTGLRGVRLGPAFGWRV